MAFSVECVIEVASPSIDMERHLMECVTRGEAAPNPQQAGWRTSPWSRAVGVSESTTRALIRTGGIKSVKRGGARIILTSPAEFLGMAESPYPAAVAKGDDDGWEDYVGQP